MNAIIIFSYASIRTMDEVEPFYQHLSHGNVKKEALNRGEEMFGALGTCDPLASNTNRIGTSLVRRLEQSTGEAWAYYIGNKHIAPFVEDAVQESIRDGANHIYTLSLTPFYTRTGSEWYEKQVKKAVADTLPVTAVPPFYAHPGVVEALARRLHDAIYWLPEDRREEAEVIFTTHSMPGTPEAHGSFISQYKQLAEQLMKTMSLKNYHLAYRSSGGHGQRWLEPDILDTIQEVADKGAKTVIVSELLSVIANAEAIRERGTEAKTLAEKLGMMFVQTEYLNDSDEFLHALADHILQELSSS